jgi:hypothetical protein
MRELHQLLGLLQVAAARIPPMAPGEEDDGELAYQRASVSVIRQRIPIDAYSVVFDPFENASLDEDNPPKAVVATIADDLGDIYNDLMEGLVLHRAGQSQNALWQWRFPYYAHWGRHLSHAQTAIWQHLSEGNSV